MISSMADLHIRNVPLATLDAIKERAARKGRSVQAEALETLERGAEPTGLGLVAWLKTVRPKLTEAQARAASAAGRAAIRESRDER
jgi:plasmid stability protein